VYGSASSSTQDISRGSAIQNFQAGVFTDSKVSAWRIVDLDLDLDRVQGQLNSGNSQLIYRHLRSYRGPSYLISTSTSVSQPTLAPSQVTLVPYEDPEFVPFPSN